MSTVLYMSKGTEARFCLGCDVRKMYQQANGFFVGVGGEMNRAADFLLCFFYHSIIFPSLRKILYHDAFYESVALQTGKRKERSIEAATKHTYWYKERKHFSPYTVRVPICTRRLPYSLGKVD